MPYEWSPEPPQRTPRWHLSLWPYRSLLRKDFVLFMGATALLISLPLVTLVGTAVLWGLLPFFALMFGGLWYALHLSYRRGEVLEELDATEDEVMLVRHDPGGKIRDWSAKRHWVSVHLHPSGGPVENYITLRGGSREVELGSFLDASERLALYDDLKHALRRQA